MSLTESQRVPAASAPASPPVVDYAPASQFPGWTGAAAWIASIIREYGCESILEVGAGERPALGAEDVAALGVQRYCINDVDPAALTAAHGPWQRWVADVAAADVRQHAGAFGLVFSRMVNEHVADPRRYHANILHMLRPGGLAVHAFATLYALPFVVNKLAPAALSQWLLARVAPHASHRKCLAYYRWCRGPTRRQIARFESLGYEVVACRGYFGHGYYAQSFPLLHRLEQWKAKRLLHHPIARAAAYATVVLRRPASQ